MAQTLFKLLHQRHPSVALDVLAPAWSLALLARMPEVRAGIPMPVGHGKLGLGIRRQLAQRLALSGYDQAIILPNSWKSALVPWLAGIPVRRGWRGELRFGLLNDHSLLDKSAFPRMVERFAALAWPAAQIKRSADLPALPLPQLQADAAGQQQALTRLQLQHDRPCLALCPGAEFGEAKRWPEAQYAEVAQHYLQQGWQLWLFGSHKDRHGCEQIIQLLPEAMRAQAVNLAGETELAEAVDLLALADLVVSNDSGLMHVAAALGRPLVAVYGSTSPDFTPPLGEQVQIVRSDIDCSPCFQRTCPYGHYRCLRELGSERVLEALQQLESQR